MKKFIAVLVTLILVGSGIFIYFEMQKEDTPKEETKDPVINKTKDDEVTKEETKKLTFVATGDALIHQSVYYDFHIGNDKYDFTSLLKHIKPIIKTYDLAFYNQETIFGGQELGYSHYPRFNTPSEFGDSMLDAGFNMVSLANNHSLDKGEAGILNSMKYWKKQENIAFAGTNSSEEENNTIPTYEKNGITYALLAYTTTTNGLSIPSGKSYLLNTWNENKIKSDIKQVRDSVDVVIVSVHWGVENTHTVNDDQKNKAKFLADLGVDIIVGTHPHVLQPITKIDDTYVMYSLGNFVSAQRTTSQLTGALASLEIEKKDGKITISNPEVQLVYTYRTSDLRNFQVIPYSQLTEKYFKDYKTAFEEQKAVIQKYDKDILVK